MGEGRGQRQACQAGSPVQLVRSSKSFHRCLPQARMHLPRLPPHPFLQDLDPPPSWAFSSCPESHLGTQASGPFLGRGPSC